MSKKDDPDFENSTKCWICDNVYYFRCTHVFIVWKRYENLSSKKYNKANNNYLKSYDPNHESKHVYLDANNLYGYAMSKFLPTGRLKWINPKKLDSNKYSSNSWKVVF